jgi:hypothetical protein
MSLFAFIFPLSFLVFFFFFFILCSQFLFTHHFSSICAKVHNDNISNWDFCGHFPPLLHKRFLWLFCFQLPLFFIWSLVHHQAGFRMFSLHMFILVVQSLNFILLLQVVLSFFLIVFMIMFQHHEIIQHFMLSIFCFYWCCSVWEHFCNSFLFLY